MTGGDRFGQIDVRRTYESDIRRCRFTRFGAVGLVLLHCAQQITLQYAGPGATVAATSPGPAG